MKIVVNKAFGGYSVPTEIANEIGVWEYDESKEVRTNEKFIDWVESHPGSDLKVVEIPDNFTDWTISDYDGFETIYVVVDGRIIKF